MDDPQVHQSTAPSTSEAPVVPVAMPVEASASQFVIPAQACPTCTAARAAVQNAPSPWAYVIGDVDPRYPSLAVEKEVIGAMARVGTKGLSNDAALLKVLGTPDYAYLVREMCFVLLVQEVETYILVPRFPQDYPMLVAAAGSELSAVIGTVGLIANPDVCNGLTVPFLVFDMIYNFDRPSFVESIPLPDKADANKFRTDATNIFNKILPLIGSGTGMNRALAYLLVKDPRLFHEIADAYNQNAQLTSVETRAAPVSSTQNLVDVIVRTQDRKTGVQSGSYARVALAGKLPYVVTYWQPYLGQ